MAQKMTTKKIASLQGAKNCTFLEALTLHFQVSAISAQRAQKKTEISKFIRKRQKNDKEMTMLRDMYDIFATCKIVMCCHFLFLFVI